MELDRFLAAVAFWSVQAVDRIKRAGFADRLDAQIALDQLESLHDLGPQYVDDAVRLAWNHS